MPISTAELMPSFDDLSIWELTHVVSSGASNVDLAWGRETVNAFSPQLRDGEKVVTLTSMMKYQGSQIPYSGFSTLLAGGGKCGPRSSFGVFINQAFGIPSIGVAQPQHAAVCWRDLDGKWQVGYGKSWSVSKVFDRYKMSGHEFLEKAAERDSASFGRIEHIRWLAALIERPNGPYLPPADRRYAKLRATTVMKLASSLSVHKNARIQAQVFSGPKPDQVTPLQTFEAANEIADNFYARVRGFLYPPASGSYVLSIASDDQADLFLSTDDDPEMATRIAFISDWAPKRKYDKFIDQQQSKPVELIAGKKYYIEARHRENVLGDSLSIAWHRVGKGQPSVINGQYLSPYPSGAKGAIIHELWLDAKRQQATRFLVDSDTAAKPEAPIKVAPGVIHVEAEDFIACGGVAGFGGQHPSMPVVDAYDGGKQLHFQAIMGDANVGYRVNIPETAVYELTARIAAVTWGQQLHVRAFGNMYHPKRARVSAVFHNMHKDLGAEKLIDRNQNTRWAVNEGVDKAWAEFDLGAARRVSAVAIDERRWNRVSSFLLEYKDSADNWQTIFQGTNIGVGYGKTFAPVTAQYLRLNILECRENGGPSIWSVDFGDQPDAQTWLKYEWTADAGGTWQTTKPIDISLTKGEQSIWLSALFQRGLSLKWFELKPKQTQ